MTPEVHVPTTQAEVDVLEASYRPFLPVTAWSSLSSDRDRWQRHCDDLRDAVTSAGVDAWSDQRQRFLRAAAMESTAIAELARPMSDVTAVVLSPGVDNDEWQQVVNDSQLVVECHRRALVVASDVAATGARIDELLIAQLQDLVVESQQTFTVTVDDGSRREVSLPHRQYKPVTNYLVRPGYDLVPFAPASRVVEEMSRLAEELASEAFANLHPLVQSSFLHVSITRIHPFADGNGRLARTLASIPLLRATGLPLLVLSDQWPAYVDALAHADDGALSPFVDFVEAVHVNALDLARNLLATRREPTPPLASSVATSPQRLLRDLVLAHARAATVVTTGDRVAVTAADAGAPGDVVRIVVSDASGRPRADLTVHVDPPEGQWLRLRCGDERLDVWAADVAPVPVEVVHLRVRAWLDRLLAQGGAFVDSDGATTNAGARGLFVVGVPRSGTTMMSSYLGSHPDVLDLGEYGGFYVGHSVGPAYLSRLPGRAHDEFVTAMQQAAAREVSLRAEQSGCRWYCDGTPWNLEVVGALAAQLPDAVFVLTLRHFSGAVLSLRNFAWAGRSWQDAAGLWASFYGALDHLPSDRTLVVSYDGLAADPAAVVPAVDKAMGDLGIDPVGFDRRTLAGSHAALVGRPRPTIAEVVDGVVQLAPIDSLDREQWTPEIHAQVWPAVAQVHAQLRERFGDVYVAPARPDHAPLGEW